jgi:hypothetical protein
MIAAVMPFIYLNKLFLPEKNRVDPDEIRMIEPMEDGIGIMGSIVTFTNNDVMRYKETPQEIERKEWQMRYLWPNVEKIIMAFLGGVIGALVTMLFRNSTH